MFTALLSTLAPTAHAADAVCNVTRKKANLNFTVKDINGKDVRLSQYKGKVVLLNFWATWCGPCKVEIPEFVEIYGKYKDKGLEVVGVAMDADLAKIKSFAAEYKMNYPILIGAGAEGVMRAWDVSGLPTTFLVSRDGRVCRKFVGQAPREDVEQAIKSLLTS